MAAAFPSSVISVTPDVDFETVVAAAEQNSQWDEIIAIETALGPEPQVLGSSSHVANTVGSVLDSLSASITSLNTTVAALPRGTVTSVTNSNATIVVGGTPTAPALKVGTLDVVAANGPPATSWSNNNQRITQLANGVASTDAANVGQLPTFFNPRVLTVTGGTSFTPTTAYDVLECNGPSGAFSINNPSGSAARWQRLLVFVIMGGTGQAVSFGSSYISTGVQAMPANGTVLPASTTTTFGFIYNPYKSAWALYAADQVGY